MKTAAIIGCGRAPTSFDGHKVGWGIANAHAQGYREAFPGVRLYAVDPNEANLRAFAERTGLSADCCFASTEALYGAVTPECVSICTWPGLHVPQALEAIEHGACALLVEKPLAIDVFQIRELQQAARARGVRVAVAHQRRYEASFVQARNLIASGLLGQTLVIDARVGDDWDMLSWTVHWFDMASYLLDANATSVLAGVQHTGQRRYGHAVEDASVVFVEFDRGRQGTFITGPAARPVGGLTVRGERGMLVVNDTLQLWTTDGYQQITPEPTPHSFAALLGDLWASVGNDHISRCDLEHAARATELAYAAHESAVTRRRVSLPSKTWYAPLEVEQHSATPPLRPPPLRVTLLADAHAQWPGESMSGREGLVDALAALGHRVTLLDATQPLKPNSLDACDLLVLYHTQQQVMPSHRQVLGRWFEAGKPVLVSHCGIGAYADWHEYRRWVGKYWVWSHEPGPPSRHPHMPCVLTVVDTSFAVGWQEAWLPIDEVYQQLGDASPVRELVNAHTADGVNQCYAWQTKAHRNVVAWLPGHRRDIFALPAVRDGLRACIARALSAE
jgi:predicted dehydrogenase